MYLPTFTLKLSAYAVGMCLFSQTLTWADMLLIDDIVAVRAVFKLLFLLRQAILEMIVVVEPFGMTSFRYLLPAYPVGRQQVQ